MVDKYFAGALPALPPSPTPYDKEIADMATSMIANVEERMDKLAFSEALIEIWNVVRRANKYIDETAPWVLAKDETKKGELANVLYHLAEILRIVAIAITPVMPSTPDYIYSQLSITNPAHKDWESAKAFGLTPRELIVQKGPAAFPRKDKV